MARAPRDFAPHNDDLERQLIGALLHSPYALNEVITECEGLEPGHFYSLQFGWIYEAILALAKRGDLAGMVMIADELKRAGHLDDIGDAAFRGIDFLNKLAGETYTTAYVGEYARAVKDYATRRALISVAREIARAAQDEDANLEGVIDDALAAVSACSAGLGDDDVAWWADVASETFDVLAHWRTSGGDTGEWATPLPDLNKLLFGVGPGEVLIVAGAPKLGKTSLMLQLAFEFGQSGPGAFYSLEMGERALMQRVIAQETGISTDSQRNMSDPQWKAFSAWFTVENTMRPILFDKKRGATAEKIAARLRSYKRQYGIEWAVVDYLQLMGTDRRDAGNRNNQIDAMLRTLKLTAMELELRLIVGSQFSREFIKSGRAPMLQDLRDSGAIEQHADKVLLIHNETGYTTEALASTNQRELIVAAHRNGPIGKVGVMWLADRMKFASLSTIPLNDM